MDCLACGITSSPATREHVFARWLLKEFGIDISMPLFRWHGDGTQERKREEIKLDAFRLKKICTACNNGWMSDLEVSAKPLILALIKGHRPLSDLVESERRILARWAGKTAIVESHAVGAECPVSGRFLKWMRNNTDNAPGGFAVGACTVKTAGFAHMQAGIIKDLIGGGTTAGNIIMIGVPKLVFACAFPLEGLPYRCKCVKSLYTPLWPSPEAWYDMDQTPMPEGLGDLETLGEMASRIELFQSVT